MLQAPDFRTQLATIVTAPTDAPAQSNIDNTVPNKHARIEKAAYSNWRDVCAGDVEAVPDQVINSDDVTRCVVRLLT